MELSKLAISSKKNKGKETMPSEEKRPVRDSKRGEHWSDDETIALLDIVDQIQTKRGKFGLSFKDEEYSGIERLFRERQPNTKRDKMKLKNRIKVMVQRFRICDDLVNRSRGGWDKNEHRPSAPSKDDYVTMVQLKGDKANFLLSGNFPWYLQMVPMVAGQSSNGDDCRPTWDWGEGEPSLHQPPTQGSFLGSEQGSSDDPKEFHHDNDDNDSVQLQHHGAGSSYRGGRGGGQSSKGTYPASQSSGSKRRSTDESTGEELNMGKRYRERNRKKTEEAEMLAQAGFAIAESMKADAKQYEDSKVESKQCVEKMTRLGIQGAAEDFVLSQIENIQRRLWFLSAADHKIWDWPKRNNVLNNQENANFNSNGLSPMFPMHSFPNINQGANNYGYPYPPQNRNL